MHTISTFIISSLLGVASLFGYHDSLLGQSALTVYQGGTGSTSPSGILIGDNGVTPRLSTLTLGQNLTLTGTTLSATGGFPFTPTTNYGALTNATGTPVWFQAGLQASSTSHFNAVWIDIPNTDVLFSDNGTVAGDSNFVWNKNSAGGLTVQAPAGTGSDDGGSIHLYSGQGSQGGRAGGIEIDGGDVLSNTTGGTFYMYGGDGAVAGGNGGFLQLAAGHGVGVDGTGGNLYLQAGESSSDGSVGGDLYLRASDGGTFFLQDLLFGYKAELDISYLTGNQTFHFPNESGTTTLGTGSAGTCAQWSTTNTLTAAAGACGGSFPFTPNSYGGVANNSTTTGIWAKPASGYGLVASSTFTTFASTTELTVTGVASTSKLILYPGTQALPALTFSGDPTSGLETPSIGQFDLVAAGTIVLHALASQAAFNFGTVALPSITFVNDQDTGLFHPATNAVGLSTNGVERVRFDPNGLVGVGTTTPYALLSVFASSTPGVSVPQTLFAVASTTAAYATTTLFSVANTGSTTIGNFGTCSGTNALTTNSSGTIVCGAITGSGGAAYSFTPDSYAGAAMSATSTGIYAKPASGYGVVASSTFTTFASTTQLSVSGNTYFTGLTGPNNLAIDSTGKVYAAATTTFSGTSPVNASHANGVVTISINDAAADGSTKGAASFTAADFNSSSANISLDYTNGQASSILNNGFLSSSNFRTFSDKIGTSAALVVGQLLYATGASTTASVATSTLTASSPLTGSFTQVGSGGSLGCQTASGSQAGCISSTDWGTFNNKLGSYDPFTHPTGFSATTTILEPAGLLTGTSTIGVLVATSSLTILGLSDGLIKTSSGLVGHATNGTDYTLITALTCTGTDKLSAVTAAGVFACTADSTGAGGGVYPFTPTANFGVANASATSTLMLLTAGLSASSTVNFGNAGMGAFTFVGLTGNGGIGTTTPNWTFQLASSSASSGFKGQLALTDTNAGANLKHWLFTSEGGNFYFGTTTDAYATSTLSAFSITNSGSVAIASSAPYALLSINAPATPNPYFAIGSSTGEVFRIAPSTIPFFGIGTSTPWAEFSLNPTGLPLATPPFAIGSSTGTDFVVTQAAQVGIGTSTPFGLLSVAPLNITPQWLFTVSSSSVPASALPSFAVDQFGHIVTGGPKPTLSNCGTSPTITGNDTVGKITVGTANPRNCILTFANAWGTAPACILTGSPVTQTLPAAIFVATTTTTQISVMATSTTAVTWNVSFSSQTIMYHCLSTQ